MVRVAARADLLPFVDARVFYRSLEHEFQVKTFPPNDDTREVRRRPEQDHGLHWDNRMRSDAGERILESRESLLHFRRRPVEMRRERAHGARMLARALPEATAALRTAPAFLLD